MHSVYIYINTVYISTCFSPATTSCIHIFKGASKSIGIRVQNFMVPLQTYHKQINNTTTFIKLWGSFELAIWFFKPCKCFSASGDYQTYFGTMTDVSEQWYYVGRILHMYIYICIYVYMLKYIYTVDTWTGKHDDTWWYLHSSCSKKHVNRR